MKIVVHIPADPNGPGELLSLTVEADTLDPADIQLWQPDSTGEEWGIVMSTAEAESLISALQTTLGFLRFSP